MDADPRRRADWADNQNGNMEHREMPISTARRTAHQIGYRPIRLRHPPQLSQNQKAKLAYLKQRRRATQEEVDALDMHIQEQMVPIRSTATGRSPLALLKRKRAASSKPSAQGAGRLCGAQSAGFASASRPPVQPSSRVPLRPVHSSLNPSAERCGPQASRVHAVAPPVAPPSGGMGPEQPQEGEATYPCSDCGRRFAARALQVHRRVCKKIFMSKRKAFDSTKHRLKELGPEATQVKQKKPKTRRRTPAKKGKGKAWLAKSNALRDAMRNSRALRAAQEKGIPLDSVPMVASSNVVDDRVPCPHCGRRFNETAAERHIPRCSDIKAKPTMLKRGGGAKPQPTVRAPPKRHAGRAAKRVVREPVKQAAREPAKCVVKEPVRQAPVRRLAPRRGREAVEKDVRSSHAVAERTIAIQDRRREQQAPQKQRERLVFKPRKQIRNLHVQQTMEAPTKSLDSPGTVLRNARAMGSRLPVRRNYHF